MTHGFKGDLSDPQMGELHEIPGKFWGGKDGTAYTQRQTLSRASRAVMFERALQSRGIGSILELGANCGENLLALRELLPRAELAGLEVNDNAINQMLLRPEIDHVIADAIEDFEPKRQWDLTFTRGVLIHIHPDHLPKAYGALYYASRRWILIAEYYNPKPVEIEYRGKMGLLWKRDFAGDMMDRYPDLKLVDYGFIYHRDEHAPQDDITWFLMEKKQ